MMQLYTTILLKCRISTMFGHMGETIVKCWFLEIELVSSLLKHLTVIWFVDVPGNMSINIMSVRAENHPTATILELIC